MSSALSSSAARLFYPTLSPHEAPASIPHACAERAAESAAPAGPGDAVLASDALAMSLKSAIDRIGLVTARAAARFIEKHGWFELGFARLEDYSRERLGRSSRWLRDLAALHGACKRLPGLAEAVVGDDGGRPIGMVAALVVGRLASPGSLAAWVAKARSLTIRQLRGEAARAHAAGSEHPVDSGNEEATPAATLEHDDTEDDDRVVGLALPAPVRAAFHEAADLFRAVEGHEATLRSFADALVGEAVAGPHPPDVAEWRPKAGLPRAVVEAALARSADNWSHLAPAPTGSWAFVMARRGLERFRVLAAEAGRGGPGELDAKLRELVTLEDDLARRLGVVLAEMGDRGAWSRLGFAGLGHYAVERLGWRRSTAHDRAGAARLLRGRSSLREAHESGRIGLEAALRIGRLLRRTDGGEAVERAWVARAREATIKRLRDETRAIHRRRALAGARGEEDVSSPLTDEQWQASLRREPGMARARIGELGRLALEHPDPDVFLKLRLPPEEADRYAAAIEAARRRLASAAAQVAWDHPWPADGEAAGTAASARIARDFLVACRRLPAWVGLLSLLEDFAATWDPPAPARRRRGDRIGDRDGWRCTCAGCTSRRNLHVHHIVYRSHGGDHRPANLAMACLFHHERGEHGGLASCRGRAPLDLVWSLGRDGIGGRYVNERVTAGE